MLNIRKVFPLMFFILCLAFISCSVNQEVYLNLQGEGYINTEVVMEPVLLNTLGDLMMLTVPSDHSSSFDELLVDTKALSRDLSSRPGVNKAFVERVAEGRWTSGLEFSHINTLFDATTELTKARLLELTENTDGSLTLTGRINRENFNQLGLFFPIMNNPDFAPFNPLKNGVTSSAEYRENVDFALDTEGVKGLDSSFLILNFRSEGRIKECRGGVLNGQNSALVKIPLLDILVLNREIAFSLTIDGVN